MFQAPGPSDFIVRKAALPTATFKSICEDYIPKATAETKAIAKALHAKNPMLLFDLWQWSRRTFHYKEDRTGYEEIRLPRRSWKDRKTGIDCEDFVIVLSGILHNLHVSHTVRMADYGNGWQHIYIKVGQTTLDPVNPVFNREPPFIAKKDHCFVFSTLSGLTENRNYDFAGEVFRGVESGTTYTRVRLESMAEKKYGITDKQVTKELIELAYLRKAMITVHNSATPSVTFKELVEDYNSQANSSLRTSESYMLQQYSTPLPMAYLMGFYCGINGMRTFFEPTAGNGFLMAASGTDYKRGSWVNELSVNRYENLRYLSDTYKFTVTNRDATDPAFYASLPMFSAVLANPPFGLMPKRTFDKIQTKKIDHWIILNSLTRMYDNGRAAFIIGGHTTYDAEGRIASRDKSTGDRYFFNYLYHHYHVSDVINVNGDLYARQGTQFDVRIILISGRKRNPEGFAPLLQQTDTAIAGTWEQLYERIVLRWSQDAAVWEKKLRQTMSPEDATERKKKRMAMQAKALILKLKLLSL